MNEDIQKELMWASGALVAFVAFLLYGGISEISEIAITVGAFGVSWVGVSYFIKNFGSGGTSKQDLEKEFQWYSGMLILFLAIVFTEENQGLHDISAETYVVSKYWQGPVPLQDKSGV